jgi:alpha-N-acetylglucosaminidase
MSEIKYLHIIALLFLFSCQRNEQINSPALAEMCQRLFPQHAQSFQFELLTDSTEVDRFTLASSVDGKILIKGNNQNSLAVGLNHYLKNYCHTHVSWYATDKVEMPEQLPEISISVSIRSKCDNRFFLNYCTFGYTMPYWKWEDWERMIDWMALNGVTMPLAITGQELVWYKVWTSMGMSDQQVRSYFTGPAHLPWHRMSNVDYWQSPLPQSWLDDQEALQKKILERERGFDMTPVLPAFAGHVPAELKDIHPNSKISQMSQWGGFDEKYRSHFIDPEDSLYSVIQQLFLEEQTKLYGTDHIYGIDPFNEVDSPNWSEEYLAKVSGKIYESIHKVDSLAQWLQMTWMFYYDKEKWTQPRIQSFLNAVPDNKLILLDYYCDHTEIWRNTEQYYGKPYMWCYLGNFGGNTMMVGNLEDADSKIKRLFTEGGNNVYGLGATLEGFDVNPLMYEFVFDQAWDYPLSTEEWVTKWAMCRGGNQNTHILKAWEDLHQKIYTKYATCGQAVLMNARPRLIGTQSWNTYPDIHYDNNDLWQIWKELLKAHGVNNDQYRYDVVNVGRQVLGNLFSIYRDQFTSCYNKKDIAGIKKWGALMDSLLLDMDRLLSCETTFSIGKWLQDARDYGKTQQEQDYYEENARCILTVWGQKDTQLNDYANRGWGGLTRSFYRERWKRFTEDVLVSVINGKEFDEKQFHQNITQFEYEWTLQKGDFPIVSGENPIEVASILISKYDAHFERQIQVPTATN